MPVKSKEDTPISPSPLVVDNPSPGPEAGSQDTSQSPAGNRQARNAKNPHWQPWQDRFLAKVVFTYRPFLVDRREVAAAWDELAQRLLEDSRSQGPRSVIDRTGGACRTRFKRLIRTHKINETKSLQKTGTDEEVSDHIKTMTELVALVDGHEASKAEFLSTTKKQQDLQQKAALEMRDAAMKGCVPRTKLTDVTQLPEATVREKQGQRKRKSTSSEADKENEFPVRKCSRHQSAIEKVLQQREMADQQQLQAAREQDEHRHAEIKGGMDRMADSINQLACALNSQSKRDAERNAQQTELMKMVASMLQNQNHN
ncbi:hypothetical protein M422DRAFT_247235 [Sphaerobolus stellatus SS14]|nr:hypothetical protein M422DRAFT_247235 [Sphaerobolus stellatus SS14]